MQHESERKTIIVALLIVVAVFAVLIGSGARNFMRVRSVYEESEALIAAENYQEAKNQLSQIKDKDYKDTSALLDLCKAHIAYDDGQISRAYSELKYAKFSYQSAESQQMISDFTAQINAEYDAYCKEQERLEKEAYEKKIKTGVPFVGMSESRIGDTSLGKPSGDVRHNYECIGGEQYRANLYDFKVNGHTVFTARCVQGKVTQVWDNRDKDTSQPVYKSSTSSKKSTDTDPYHVNDYYDAEDFYYDYYDDFFDYDDAEDYFNAHHK
jgi:hypothetical protein